MLNSVFATGGIVTAPHHLAADAGRDVLRDGGNAVEAMIAMAAAIPVVYPHMNALGGDSFWIVKPAGKAPIGIDACGAAAAAATDDLYRSAGHDSIPTRGPLAANTVAGTLSGWQAALDLAAEMGGIFHAVPEASCTESGAAVSALWPARSSADTGDPARARSAATSVARAPR